MTIREDERNGGLGRQLVAEMNQLTLYRHGSMALENEVRNRAVMNRGKSIAALRNVSLGRGDSAIVIAAGPSIRQQDPLQQIEQHGYGGALVATESAIRYCLQRGVTPHLVVSVDPNPTRVVRWFGDPNLSEETLRADDYFKRQEQDTDFANEMRANDQILELLNRHGPDMRIALSTSASQTVVDRVLETGMEIFWWNPMLDDPDDADSVTATMQRENGMPALNSGGNVGTACWMMANAVLDKRRIALTGMDFGYYNNTPYFNTQYYHEAVALVGEENLDSVYIRIHNPYLDQWYFTDPAYMWYRECLLELTRDETDCRTYNCTEGGILFGEGIDFISLKEYLSDSTVK